MALTKSTIQKTPPKDKLYYIWDSGFGVRIDPSGNKVYVASALNIQGKLKIKSLGKVSELDIKRAKEKAYAWRQDIRQHTIAKYALSDLFTQWLSEKKEQIRPRTYSNYKSIAIRFIEHSFLWGINDISKLEKHVLFRFFGGLHTNTSNKNNVYILLNSFFGWCEKKGLVEKNIANGVWEVQTSKQRERVLSIEEIQRLWKATNILDTIPKTYIRILILSGQRRTEVASIQIQDIDTERKVWTIPASKNKGKRTHELPLTDFMLSILQPLMKNKPSESYIFSNIGSKPLTNFTRIKQKLCLQLASEGGVIDIRDWRFHDFRRSMSTHLIENGVSPFVVKRLLNHSVQQDLGVTAIYARNTYLKEKLETLKTWGDILTNEM